MLESALSSLDLPTGSSCGDHTPAVWAAAQRLAWVAANVVDLTLDLPYTDGGFEEGSSCCGGGGGGAEGGGGGNGGGGNGGWKWGGGGGCSDSDSTCPGHTYHSILAVWAVPLTSLAQLAFLAERRPNTCKCGYIGKSVVISCYYYVLLRISSSLLLISNLVIMCNNDVVIGYHYYVFLPIIDLCTKCRQKRRHRQCLCLRFRGGL